MHLPVLPPVRPMLARPAPQVPEGRCYEPKWDGFRTVVFRDGDEIELGSRNERPMTRYFPEVVEAVRASLPPRCVVDGEVVLVDADTGVLDFDRLQLRLHPAASRVARLAAETPCALVVFDVLALGDEDLTGLPFAQRRARLEELLPVAPLPLDGPVTGVRLTPLTRDRDVALDWFDRLEGAGLDGVVAKAEDLTYQPDKRVMTKVKHVRTLDCVVAGYRPHTSGPDAVGSLMLGLWDEHGGLDSLGVIGALPMARRRALVDELAPYVTDLAGHPWDWGGAAEGLTDAQRRSFGSRWNAGKSLAFVPLRPELVVEARYDFLDGGRFRHTAQLSRWRPDRDARSCTWDQVERPEPVDVRPFLAGGG
ncbi:ATP-dependent DNA ligase [Lapillicoccus jejuensis]|uniref:ATP-dependent DNA ligase n=1 Tax=Lapillicoccus jejuensis TaxID=402171 RepID=A0A542E4Z3_9MICO|nr:ATP-dependent DNA ligase [Lapillicoccus jejuensis]TQJ10395.1 ATP-dependent DNA ligase [Lapillicoccus jejuensis]